MRVASKLPQSDAIALGCRRIQENVSGRRFGELLQIYNLFKTRKAQTDLKICHKVVCSSGISQRESGPGGRKWCNTKTVLAVRTSPAFVLTDYFKITPSDHVY